MRYSLIQAIPQSKSSIAVYPQNVVPNTRVFSSVDAVKYTMQAGYEIVSTVDGIIHLQLNSGGRFNVVAIPETHPLFNGFILYKEEFTTLQVHKGLDLIRDECRRVILGR